ncbi:MAG: response regulator [Clostridiales bacterium]|nr:response regulator [Clostridiales bacterium]
MSSEKVKILVVDDVETNRIILEEILSDDYEIECAEDGMDAISKMLNSLKKPTLVLLDIMMPGMDGFEVLSFMKSSPLLNKISVIFITAAEQETRGLSAGAVDYISKPFDLEIVKLRVANQIELFLYREKLEGLVEQKANELLVAKEHFLDTMAELIEYRSLESGQHVKRTRELARILITQLLKNKKYHDELINKNVPALVKAVPLHDIGKIGIPDNILLKPGKLTPEEFKVIETHTVIGSEVIKSLMSVSSDDDYLGHCYDICRHHHERWDGKGYPDRMAGADIPLAARIVSIVDVYDALTSERCYKKAFTHDEAMNILKQNAGSQFDEELVNAFAEVEEQVKNWEEQIKN